MKCMYVHMYVCTYVLRTTVTEYIHFFPNTINRVLKYTICVSVMQELKF